MNFSVFQQNRIVYSNSIKERCFVCHQMGWVIKGLFHACLQNSQTVTFGTVGDLMQFNLVYCTRPKSSCNSASGRPWHLGVIVLTILQTGMKKLYNMTLSCIKFLTLIPLTTADPYLGHWRQVNCRNFHHKNSKFGTKSDVFIVWPFSKTIRVSNSLDPDQDCGARFVSKLFAKVISRQHMQAKQYPVLGYLSILASNCCLGLKISEMIFRSSKTLNHPKIKWHTFLNAGICKSTGVFLDMINKWVCVMVSSSQWYKQVTLSHKMHFAANKNLPLQRTR